MYFTACTSTSGGSNLVVSIDEATAQGLLSTLYSSLFSSTTSLPLRDFGYIVIYIRSVYIAMVAAMLRLTKNRTGT